LIFFLFLLLLLFTSHLDSALEAGEVVGQPEVVAQCGGRRLAGPAASASDATALAAAASTLSDIHTRKGWNDDGASVRQTCWAWPGRKGLRATAAAAAGGAPMPPPGDSLS
jgi:hypothetical protein